MASSTSAREIQSLSAQLGHMLNKQLQSICQLNGLKTSGIKADLQKRIIEGRLGCQRWTGQSLPQPLRLRNSADHIGEKTPEQSLNRCGLFLNGDRYIYTQICITSTLI